MFDLMQFNEVNVFPLPRGMDMVNLFFLQCIFENRYLEILYVNIHIKNRTTQLGN